MKTTYEIESMINHLKRSLSGKRKDEKSVMSQISQFKEIEELSRCIAILDWVLDSSPIHKKGDIG